METKPKIHDNIIKHFLLDHENAISVIRGMLPPQVQEHLELESIRYEKDTFIPKHLKEYYSDLLTSVPIKDQDADAKVYFLLEHKSTYKETTPLQLLRYMVEFWDQFIRNSDGIFIKMPVVIPILIAHPEYGWRAKKISDLINIPSDDFRIYLPDFDFLLFDAVKDDPENYEFDEAVKALFTIWKYAHTKEFLQAVKRVFELIRQIDPQVRLHEYLQIILKYLELTREEEEYAEIKKIAETEINEGEEYMGTIAEMFRREGDERTKFEYEEKLAQLKNEWSGQAKVEATQETLIDVAADLYGPLPNTLQTKIKSIQSIENLRTLTRKIHRTNSFEEFTELVNRATQN
ncbi:MAG: Rpn family recombination-promoting nuclease/putative transposase [Desulfovermiculus sp.]